MLHVLIVTLSFLILSSSNLHAQNFMGYLCTEDWSGNSNSFIEGCIAYAEEQENEQKSNSDESQETEDSFKHTD